MLPGLDGIEVCKQIQREHPLPGADADRARQRDRHARRARRGRRRLHDEAVQRASSSRVHALLRRADRPASGDERSLRIGSIELDAPSRRVRQDGELVHLTPIEFDLLQYLATRPGRVASREELLVKVWGYEVPSGAHGRLAHPFHPPQARRRRRAHRARRRLRRRRRCRVKRPPERPLDPLPTLKLKLSVVILAAVAVTVVVFWAGVRLGMWPSLAGVIAGIISLVVVFFLSRGLTSPLREMVAATEAMARGDFSQRITATSHDEIGTLARSFNQMAAELAETDRLRRDLVANVSHELRTPITALQAVLENIVDGVAEPDPETFATMLSQVERLGRLVQQLLDLSRLESGTLPSTWRAVRDRADARPRAASRGCTPATSRSRSRSSRSRSRSKPTPSACTKWSPTSSRTRCGTRRPAAACSCGRSRRPTAPVSKCSTKGRASPRPTRPACSSVSTGPTPRARSRRRCRSRPGHRPLDRRAARRRHPARTAGAARLPHGRAHPGPRRAPRGTGAHRCRCAAERAASPENLESGATAPSEVPVHQRKRVTVSLTTIDDALRRIRRGEMVLVVDDEDRENEGDLTLAAEWVTAGRRQLHVALGARARVHAVRRHVARQARHRADGAAGPRRLRHRVHRVDRPPQRGLGHRRRRSRAHDQALPRSRVPTRRFHPARSRVPAARPRGRRARAARSHRSRRRSRASPGCRPSR